MLLPGSSDQTVSTRLVALIGGFALFWATAEVLSGEALRRFQDSVSRKAEPKVFWQQITIHYCLGFALVAYSIYKYLSL